MEFKKVLEFVENNKKEYLKEELRKNLEKEYDGSMKELENYTPEELDDLLKED